MGSYYNGVGQEIVQCSNAHSHATIALLNEARPSDKSSDFVFFPSGLTQTALELFCMQLLWWQQMPGGRRRLCCRSGRPHICSRELENSQRRSQLLLTWGSRICSWCFGTPRKQERKDAIPIFIELHCGIAAALLFSTTNAFKYVRILADFAISFHCCSDMETAVWDAFVFTQQTVNGKRIWSDRGVESSIFYDVYTYYWLMPDSSSVWRC